MPIRVQKRNLKEHKFLPLQLQ